MTGSLRERSSPRLSKGHNIGTGGSADICCNSAVCLFFIFAYLYLLKVDGYSSDDDNNSSDVDSLQACQLIVGQVT